jgi:hypothetical protein
MNPNVIAKCVKNEHGVYSIPSFSWNA